MIAYRSNYSTLFILNLIKKEIKMNKKNKLIGLDDPKFIFLYTY